MLGTSFYIGVVVEADTFVGFKRFLDRYTDVQGLEYASCMCRQVRMGLGIIFSRHCGLKGLYLCCIVQSSFVSIYYSYKQRK